MRAIHAEGYADKDADWRAKAACTSEDPELFFPNGGKGKNLLQINEAKAVCIRCLAREACLRWALEHDVEYGVWGGMSEAELRALRRRKSRKKAS